MKKKATSQSAFFNLRLLVGLFVALVGISLLALGALATANPARHGAPAGTNAPASPNKYKVTNKSSIDPLVPAMFDCSKIRQFGVNKQENMRAGAIMIHCGQAKGGDPDKGVAGSSACSRCVQNLTAPLVGSTDADLITGRETATYRGKTCVAGDLELQQGATRKNILSLRTSPSDFRRKNKRQETAI